ncbi:hypothetical protein ACU4HD_44060 [Cupriavidus basilensis]
MNRGHVPTNRSGACRSGRWTPAGAGRRRCSSRPARSPRSTRKPDVGTPNAFKEAAPSAQATDAPLAANEQGKWKTAEPALPADGAWWKIFNDPTLDKLEAAGR